MSKMRGYCATFLQRFGARIAVGVHNKALSVVPMCVSIQTVRPSESTAETQFKLQPTLLSPLAITSESFTNPTVLVGVLSRLRRSLAQFKLCAHFLDLRSL